jgi:hypothetical protein
MVHDLDGSGRTLIEVLPRHLPGGTEENHKKYSVRTGGVPAGIREEHRPNTSLERYHYANPLGLQFKVTSTDLLFYARWQPCGAAIKFAQSVCPYETTREPLDVFTRNLGLENYTKSCRAS